MPTGYQADFGPFDGAVWLNCAHQGPLPRVAAEEAREAIAWKLRPWELTPERFAEVPARLRTALGRLLGAPADEVVLGNSASYGLHLLANSLPWQEGDEVLLVHGDFPSVLLPWLTLESRGVRVRHVRPARHLPDAGELAAALTPRTRVFCTTWVHSFSGVACDLEALGSLCRANGTRFVVNAAQALGARPFDVSLPVDAVVGVGFKWLCGPYGTGFLWMRPDLLRSLRVQQAYWLAQMTAVDLGKEEGDVRLPEGPPTARTFDVFGTANFFNFKPWAAALEYLLGVGIERTAQYDQQLVQRVLDGLDSRQFDVVSPREPSRRSTLVVFSHKEPARNRLLHAHLRARGIEVAYRRGRLRIAPHLYNSTDDIDRALTILNTAADLPEPGTRIVSTPPAFTLRTTLAPGDVGSIVRLHGVLYAREYGFDPTFEAYVAGPLADFVRSHPDRSCLWIAERGEAILGCIAIVGVSEKEAQLRWYLVDPSARGLGLGTTLLREAVEFCKRSGYDTVLLWTVSALTAAARLYRSFGFEKVEQKPGRLWSVEVVEEKYVLALGGSAPPSLPS
jgi:selenocysteine lyase/cysteine desulfurase/GNAT superfamily N-acetyltransferase